MEVVNNIENVKHFHLKVHYNEDTKKLIYDRILREGNGKTEYGLDVAKCIMDDDNFINLSEIIKKEYNQENEIVANKKSNYNSKLYMTNCNLCNSRENLETHHINFQKDTDKNGFIKKDGKSLTVEFAIKHPTGLYLPIDAHWPKKSYEKLLELRKV